MWGIAGQKVLETLTVEKNGLPLDDVEKDGWQDFIKEIIPLGLSQLFFFDGEKIQKMMSDDGNEELKKSILGTCGVRFDFWTFFHIPKLISMLYTKIQRPSSSALSSTVVSIQMEWPLDHSSP